MSSRSRDLISRLTMGAIALALFWAAWRCFQTAWIWEAQSNQAHPDPFTSGEDMSGGRYPILLGIALLVPAVALIAGALLSSDQLLRVFGVGNTALHENNHHRAGWLSWFLWI